VWLAAAVLCLLIIASRKHYSVDVLVAWWTVPLVFYTYHRRWTTTRPVMEEEEERFGPAMYLPQYGNAHLEHSPPHGGNASIMEMAPLGAATCRPATPTAACPRRRCRPPRRMAPCRSGADPT